MEINIVELHLIILAVTAIFIVYSDHEAFAYVRGKKQLLDAKRMHFLHRAVWTGLIGMIITGALMAYPGLSYYLTEPAYIVKMLMVFALVVNGFVIGKVSHVASETPFAELSKDTKQLLLASGAISGAGWIGAATIGYFFL